ncbi:MAG TPA: prepilin-type N-terminal cleavage/methylation domain-containing protein [Gemmatimonadales bacterium]
MRGFTLVELLVVLLILVVAASLSVPRLGSALDRIATDAAARDVTTALATARAAAVLLGTRARLRIAADSLRVDREGAQGWEPYARWPGPAASGVGLQVSNPEIVFGPLGLGWGLANTRVELRRGSQIETITTSRLGRVRRG